MSLAYDAYSTEGQAAVNNYSWSHTITGADRVVIVAVICRQLITAITFGGQAMTLIKRVDWQDGGDRYSYLYYLKNAPSGTVAVNVTWAATGPFVAGVMSFTGANQRSPIESFAFETFDGTGITKDIDTVASNTIVIDFFAQSGSAANTAGADQTGRYTDETTTETFSARASGSTEPKATPGTVTMSWSTPNPKGTLILAVLRDTEATGIRSQNSVAPMILERKRVIR